MTCSASARADVLFDSLDSPNNPDYEVATAPEIAATFMTGASSVRLSDVALLLQGSAPSSADTFTVALQGGVPLANVSFDPVFGLNVNPGPPDLASVTLPVSSLSTNLTVEHFSQLTGVALQPNALYWIDIIAHRPDLDATVNWGATADMSGVGVAENYNFSSLTDFGFFRNQGVPPFPADLALQMEISASPVPEPSVWSLMGLGFVGLGFMGWRGSRTAARTA